MDFGIHEIAGKTVECKIAVPKDQKILSQGIGDPKILQSMQTQDFLGFNN